MGHKGKEGAKGGREKAAAQMGLAALQMTTTTTSFKPKEAQDPFELLDMCVAALQDKRGTTRELAMAVLVGALEGLVPLDELDSRCLTVFALCGVSIKNGSAKEARLAYRAVGLLGFTLRAGATSLLDEAFPMLSRTIQAVQSDATTLVAAIDFLAAVTFAGALCAEDAERSLRAIWAVIFPPVSSRSTAAAKTSSSASTRKTTSPELLAAAVSAWTFLLTTTVTDAQQQRKAADRTAWTATVASLAGLLDHDDRSVRIAAGVALAVCVELDLTPRNGRDEEALRAKVADLAGEAGGNGVGKKMLPEQRDLFRQIAAFFDRGERPSRSLRVSADGHGVLKVSTWAKLVQLDFLRSFLGGGFLKHARENALLKQAFCVAADECKKLSVAQRSKDSKAKQKEMNVNRDTAWEMKNVMCLPQDQALENHKPSKRLLQIGWH